MLIGFGLEIVWIVDVLLVLIVNLWICALGLDLVSLSGLVIVWVLVCCLNYLTFDIFAVLGSLFDLYWVFIWIAWFCMLAIVYFLGVCV